MSVLCPDCCIEGAVYDSRLVGTVRVRRRRCPKCNARWNTYEGADQLADAAGRKAQAQISAIARIMNGRFHEPL